jgi:uncharacterized membrane-anchored protein
MRARLVLTIHIVRLPNDIEPLVEIINMTGACVLLLQLRMYLKHYYNFTEA